MFSFFEISQSQIHFFGDVSFPLIEISFFNYNCSLVIVDGLQLNPKRIGIFEQMDGTHERNVQDQAMKQTKPWMCDKARKTWET